MEQKKTIKLILEDDVINGFSPSFSKILLEKLKKLNKEKKIFLKAQPSEKYCQVTAIGQIIIRHLEKQLIDSNYFILEYLGDDTNAATQEEIDTLITVAEEFLECFEKK